MRSRSHKKKPHMHWAMRLHNELQRQGRLRELTWDDKRAGPSHNVIWTSIALINEIEYGRGTARKKQTARDEAAKKALDALEDELFEPNPLDMEPRRSDRGLGRQIHYE